MYMYFFHMYKCQKSKSTRAVTYIVRTFLFMYFLCVIAYLECWKIPAEWYLNRNHFSSLINFNLDYVDICTTMFYSD